MVLEAGKFKTEWLYSVRAFFVTSFCDKKWVTESKTEKAKWGGSGGWWFGISLFVKNPLT